MDLVGLEVESSRAGGRVGSDRIDGGELGLWVSLALGHEEISPADSQATAPLCPLTTAPNGPGPACAL